VFRQHGYQREAEDLLIAQRRDAARAVARRPGTSRRGAALHHARSALFGSTVGYGYRPGRVLWMLAALLVAVTVTVLLPDAQATFRATDPAGNVYATTGRLVTVAAPDGVTNAESFTVPAARAPASDPCGDGQVRCFNPMFYAVDTVVPLVTLGQRSTWYPNRAAPWGTVVDTLAQPRDAPRLGPVVDLPALVHQNGQDRLTHAPPPYGGVGAVGSSTRSCPRPANRGHPDVEACITEALDSARRRYRKWACSSP